MNQSLNQSFIISLSCTFSEFNVNQISHHYPTYSLKDDTPILSYGGCKRFLIINLNRIRISPESVASVSGFNRFGKWRNDSEGIKLCCANYSLGCHRCAKGFCLDADIVVSIKWCLVQQPARIDLLKRILKLTTKYLIWLKNIFPNVESKVLGNFDAL